MNENNLENEKDLKPKWSLKGKAKKMLAIFSIGIIVCTVVSRSVASFTTPTVDVCTPNRGCLQFVVEGDGVIKAAGEIYEKLATGVKVKEVYVKQGDSVVEGQKLFAYDMESLKEKIDAAEAELLTLNTDYQKGLLENQKQEEPTDLKTPQNTYDRAVEDYNAAKEKLKTVKKEYKKEIEKINKKISEDKAKEYEEANENYENAKDNYEDKEDECIQSCTDAVNKYNKAVKTKEKAIAAAENEVKKAEAAYEKVTKKKELLESYINSYGYYAVQKDMKQCNDILKKIYEEYFGKKEYQRILKKIDKKYQAYVKAQSTYNRKASIYNKEVNEIYQQLQELDKSSEEYSKTYQKYLDAVERRDDNLEDYQSRMDEAYDEIALVNESYAEITKAAQDYSAYMVSSSSFDDHARYDAFYNSVIDSTVYDEVAANSAKEVVEEKEAALAETRESQQELVNDAMNEKNKAEKDKRRALELENKKVKAAKKKLNDLLKKDYSNDESVKNALSNVETQEAEVKRCKRAVEDAKITLDNTLQKTERDRENKEIEAKINTMTTESTQNNIKKKNEEIEKLKALKKNDGVMSASMTGIVTQCEIKPKSDIVGNELVAITPSNGVFVGKFDSELRKYVKEGETVRCKLDTKEKEVEGEILSVNYDSVNNNYEFTAKLPDDEYTPNTNGTFVYKQNSEKYETIIPISALHDESDGVHHYVLAVNEENTILGTEQRAMKYSVEVLANDQVNVAVKNVTSDMKIITNGSREIMEGDRVRMSNNG